MRSFMKLFLDAFNEATEKPEFVAFADKDILEKIFGWQGEVNPDNVF